MPYFNLGNIITNINGASLYNYSYHPGLNEHWFNGNTQFGFCRCNHDYSINDIIKVNNNIIEKINKPSLIKENAWIYFIIENNAMYIFNNAEQFSIPDGALIEPINDLAVWCACAGINWYEIGCPSAKNLVESQIYCSQLFNSENAFNYYKRSNKIIKDTISVGNTIAILNTKPMYETSYMTSASSHNQIVTVANTSLYDGAIYGCFSNAAQCRFSERNNAGEWIQLEIPESIWPYKFTIIPTNQHAMSMIFIWQASIDGQHWTDLMETPSVTTAATRQTFYNIKGGAEKYRFFRLYVKQSTSKSHWNPTQGKIYGFI